MFRTVTVFFVQVCCLLAFVFLLNAGRAAAQAPAWAWGLQSTNPIATDDSPAAGLTVATDAAGRAYVGGNYGSTLPGSAGTTRRFGNAGSVGPGRGGFVAQATATGQWAWVTDVVATSSNAQVSPQAWVESVVVTPAGDVYASGTVVGTALRLGNQSRVVSAGSSALFVARLTSAGVCQWLQVVNGTFTATTLALDPSTGGVVLAGGYLGTPLFGALSLPASTGAGNGSLVVARMSASGQWLATATSSGTAGLEQVLWVCVGAAGQVAVSATQTAGNFVFGPFTLAPWTGRFNGFVLAQLSPTNQWQWARSEANNEGGTLTHIAYTLAGNLWVSGIGFDGAVIGPLAIVAPGTFRNPGSTGFVGQLSATGQWNMARQFSSSSGGSTSFTSLAVDGAGDVLVLGSLDGGYSPAQATLGSQTYTVASAQTQTLVARLTSAGLWRPVAALPVNSITNRASFIESCLDVFGNFYAIGGFYGVITVGPSSLNSPHFPGNFTDLVLAKLGNATALGTQMGAGPTATTAALALFPSPAHLTATLRLPAPASQQTTFALLDALGRPARTFAVPAGATEATLDLKDLPAGLYLVRGNGMSARLVVE